MSIKTVCTAAALLATLGLSVPALAQCDITGPSLDGLALTPPAVDTSSSSENVTCTMTLSDDLSGVREAACLFCSPVYLQSHTCVPTSPASGTRQNGVFECTVTLPPGCRRGLPPPGELNQRLGGARAGDRLGRRASLRGALSLTP